MAWVLPPSEFSGELGTAVGGRVVLRRKVKLREQEQQGTRDVKGKQKSKGGGKSRNATGDEKCEVHLLGGSDMTEVLYVEAYAEDHM